MRHLQPLFVGILFVITGALHFKFPAAYEQIMPPFIPAHAQLVALSGAFEILGGLGVLVPQTRKFSAWGLIALLIAVFPANIYMAVDADKFAKIPAWGLWARLPIQFFLMAWVYNACIKPLPAEG
jgi:uncharacterized membrane protein